MGIEFRKGAWYLRLKGLDGRWRYEKTEAKTKAAAALLYAEESARLERARRGLVALDLNPRKHTLASLARWWLDRYSVRLAAHAKNVQSVTKHLVNSPHAALPIERVTPGIVQQIVMGVQGAAQTRVSVRGFLSRMFAAAIAEELFLGPNPVARVKKPKVHQGEAAWLEREDLAVLFASLRARSGERHRRHAREAAARLWLYQLAVYTGMRRGELFALTWSDVDLARGVINVRRSNARSTPKGGRARVVDIAPELRPLLEEHRRGAAASDLVCPGKRGEQRSPEAKAAKQLRADLTRAGIARDLTFHDLRHTFAAHFLMSGGDLVALQRLLGHSSPVITERTYGHLARSHFQAAMARFSLKPARGAVVGRITGAKR